jgi:CDP-diacylglycerol---glycerol-3-phosphate 3-phosphatidyltransferase
MPFTIPNLLTWLRLALIPVFVTFYYLPFHWNHIVAAIVFTLAALTDWLDGFLARTLNQSSPFGEFLDPVADKLIVMTALVVLAGNLPYLTFAAIVIIAREIAISALREWMAEIGKRANVAVSFVSKVKTFVQMIAVALLLAASGNEAVSFWYNVHLILGYGLLYCAVALTLWSMVVYLRAAWPSLSMDRPSK